MTSLTTLIITFFLHRGGTITQAHQYATPEDCLTVAQMFDGQTNPLGEHMTARCVKE